mgnify:CR=1 FL=1
MKKNGEYAGVDEKFIPENEKYVDESILGNKEESKKKIYKIGKTVIIVYILIIVLMFVIPVGVGIWCFVAFNKSADNQFETFNNMSGGIISNIKGKIEKDNLEADVAEFNAGLTSLQGTQSKFFLSRYLDNIITKNKTYSNHTITVTYNDITTTEEDEIIKIKHSLKDGCEYEVSVDYDANGYINRVKIMDI